MDRLAVFIVETLNRGWFSGKLLDPEFPGGLTKPLRVDFEPGPRPPYAYELHDAKAAREAAERSAFVEVMAGTGKGDALVVAGIRGLEGPDDDTPAALVSAVRRRIPAPEVGDLMKSALKAAGGSFGPVDPDSNIVPLFRMDDEALLGGDRMHVRHMPVVLMDLQHEAAGDHARRQPDEGIVWVSSKGEGFVLDHHGAYLFWATDNGNEAEVLGLDPLPSEKGLYYFRGKSWADPGDGWEREAEAGLSVDVCVPAAEEHFALFGEKSEEAYAEAIGEIEAACAPIPSGI